MGQIAAKIAGFDDLKKDVEDLKKAAELMRGITGHLDGKAKMVENGFDSLKKAKSVMDSQVGSVMENVNKVSAQTQQITNQVTNLEKTVNDLQEKAKMAQGAAGAYNKFKGGDVMGGVNDLKNAGFGKFGF